jgi:hypothetical protein
VFPRPQTRRRLHAAVLEHAVPAYSSMTAVNHASLASNFWSIDPVHIFLRIDVINSFSRPAVSPSSLDHKGANVGCFKGEEQLHEQTIH